VSAAEAARAFALPSDDVAVSPLGGGHINASWIVAAGGVRYVLQRLNTHVFPRPDLVMENVARVTAFTSARDARALRLVPSRTGTPWHVDASGGWWRLFPFVEGTVTRETARSPDEAYEAARAFGRFQRLLGAYDGPRLHETIPGFHDTPRRLAALERAASRDVVGRLAECRSELDALLGRRALGHALLDAHARGDAPERVTHNDAKLANVLLDARTGEGVCVVDLDTVMPGLSPYDYGDLARSTASDAPEDEIDLARVVVRRDVLHALAAGFLDGTGDLLGAAERGLLATAAQVITYEQAARFLTDFLDGDAYYRVAVDRPLHNLERARAQLRLLTAFEEA